MWQSNGACKSQQNTSGVWRLGRVCEVARVMGKDESDAEGE